MRDVQADRLERMNRFVKRMNEVERDLTAPYVRPKDAATLILVDRSGPLPKVLLGKRHERHKFMPGKFVFPGGRVDPADRLMPVAKPLDPHAEANLMKHLQRASAAKARAFALAAIRETFEETGLLLGVRAAFHRPRHHSAWPAASLRRALLHPRRERDRASGRGRDRPRCRTRRTGLDAADGCQAAGYAGRYRRDAGGARRAHRRRVRPRPAGSILQHAAGTLQTGPAVTPGRFPYIDIGRQGIRFRASSSDRGLPWPRPRPSR
jgi:8-oxo-dGTP pyrophosphatase MutT (NUDIX family)